MNIFVTKKDHHWEFESSDGKHEINLKMGSSSREKMDLFLDKRRVETLKYTGTSMIPHMEYRFACGDEAVTFILHGSQVDMVYNGKLLGRKTEYDPQSQLPIIVRFLLLVLPISAIASIYLFPYLFSDNSNSYLSYLLTVVMVLADTVISYSNLTSPLCSKKKKYMYGVLGGIVAWITAFLILLVL